MSAPENAGSIRNVTESPDPDKRGSNLERYRIFVLCECPRCGGLGKAELPRRIDDDVTPVGRCPECRGEGRVRQEIATCPSPEALGVALVTLGREGEFEDCPIGILDSEGEVGQKWLVRPWTPSARNVTDAARTLAKSRGGRS